MARREKSIIDNYPFFSTVRKLSLREAAHFDKMFEDCKKQKGRIKKERKRIERERKKLIEEVARLFS